MNTEVINKLAPNFSYSCTTVSTVGYNAAMHGLYTSTPQEQTLNNSWSLRHSRNKLSFGQNKY